MAHRLPPALALALIVVIMACGGQPEHTPPRTAEQQRQSDSTIGASALPGARSVQGALRASDSAAARRAQLDSLARQP